MPKRKKTVYHYLNSARYNNKKIINNSYNIGNNLYLGNLTENNPYLNKMLFGRREGIHIPKGPSGARLMLQVLKEGKFISILCDQKFREGMTVPFFGTPAQTATSIATLALN